VWRSEFGVDKEKIEKILVANRKVLRKDKVNKVSIFRSYAKDKAKKKSDVDLLVEFDEVIDLFDFVHLTGEVEKVLKINVDLATPDAIKPLSGLTLKRRSI
jgi:predicted nucleotidyltransferase